jgi:hypothetical protein
MNFAVKSKLENDYLQIKGSRSVVDIEEYKLLVKRYCDEISKYGIKKIILDETRLQYAKSIVLQTGIVDFYSKDYPESSSWKVASVVNSDLIDFGKFWEQKAKQLGCYYHKAFTSIEEARKFISD